MKLGFIDTLPSTHVQAAVDRIDQLYNCWIRRGIYCGEGGFSADDQYPIDFYTLGAVTYIDGLSNLDEYYRYAKDINPILKDFFGWLYDIVLDKLSSEIGPCELIDELAHPGFHVFGHPPNKEVTPFTNMYLQQPLATIHYDLQHEKHLRVWEKYEEYDFNNPLSFTLALELPDTGGGLNTWEESLAEQYDRQSEFSKGMKSLSYLNQGPPTVVEYEVGKMFYFIGPLLHQIAPAYKPVPSDRRITLQGHGILCDGVWKIYF